MDNIRPIVPNGMPLTRHFLVAARDLHERAELCDESGRNHLDQVVSEHDVEMKRDQKVRRAKASDSERSLS